jgi:hypothetical protein
MLRKTVSLMFVLSIPGASLAQDSYVCAKGSLEERFTATQKTVADQLGASVIDVRGVSHLCNATTSSSHPGVHQVGYKSGLAKDVQQAKFERSDHTVYDQFGPQMVSLTKAAGVLAASAMIHGGDGTETTDTTGVDHFQCYKASRASGSAKFLPPPPFSVQDTFGPKTITISKISKVCAPASLDADNPAGPTHAGHLICYRARLQTGEIGGMVSINNESFGPGLMTLKSLTEYCVPGFLDSPP